MRPAFVTFEGIDGSGKTTIARRVHRALRKSGVRVVLTSEPTRSWLGTAVRRSYRDDVGPFAESLLFLADRAVHSEEIRRWLRAGNVVLCDRYVDSTYAYQGARLARAMKDPIAWLRNVSAPFVVRPDLTFLLRVTPELGLRRIAGRKRHIRFEEKAFLGKVARVYDRLARDRRFVVLDGSRSAAETSDHILRILRGRFGP